MRAFRRAALWCVDRRGRIFSILKVWLHLSEILRCLLHLLDWKDRGQMPQSGCTATGGFAMIYILAGEDESRMDYRLEEIKRKEKCDSLTRLNAKECGEANLLYELDTMNLFYTKPLVIVDNASFLSAKNDTGIDPQKIADRPIDDKVAVFLVHAKKIDTRKKAVKALAARATVLDCAPLTEKNQPDEIRQMMKEKGIQMEPGAFEWFCSHAGFSAASLSMQLDKLALYADNLKLADVQALTTVEPTQNVFKMTDALFEKDRVRFLGLYRSFRAQNMEPIAILALIASQIRFVYQVRVLLDEGRSQNDMVQMRGASSGRIWNSMRNARRFRADQLLDHLAWLSRLDEQMKSGKIDKDTGFENFILQLPERSS